MNPLEASFTLCDHFNPSIGYQLRIWRGNEYNRDTVLFTSIAPDTGEDLLTAADCMRIIQMYIPPKEASCPE